jgi:hypothetical protein
MKKNSRHDDGGLRGRHLWATFTLTALVAGLPACVAGEPEIDTTFDALTTPVTGAAAKPPSWAISPPWAAGVEHRITNGYGSGEHQNVNNTGRSNDYYALDFDLSLDEAVYPIADGNVIFAGWATGGWASYGKIVFIEHTVGTVKYHSLYAHLNRVKVEVGPVTRGTLIGKAGGTGGWPVHLHLAVYKNASFQNSTAGIGPYGGKAMVPEAFSECVKNGSGSCEDLVFDNHLKRTGSGGSTCGSACTACVLTTRTDLLPFYQANGWDTSCGNRDNIVANWCSIDPAGCSSVKSGACAAVCGSSSPYPSCPCTTTDNYCSHPPQTAGCPMTFPGGYCDLNGDSSYSDADWVRGYNEYQSYCR